MRLSLGLAFIPVPARRSRSLRHYILGFAALCPRGCLLERAPTGETSGASPPGFRCEGGNRVCSVVATPRATRFKFCTATCEMSMFLFDRACPRRPNHSTRNSVFSSLQFSLSVPFDSLRPHGLHAARQASLSITSSWILFKLMSSHPLSSPSPLVFSLSQHQGLFQ